MPAFRRISITLRESRFTFLLLTALSTAYRFLCKSALVRTADLSAVLPFSPVYLLSDFLFFIFLTAYSDMYAAVSSKSSCASSTVSLKTLSDFCLAFLAVSLTKADCKALFFAPVGVFFTESLVFMTSPFPFHSLFFIKTLPPRKKTAGRKNLPAMYYLSSGFVVISSYSLVSFGN